MKKHVKNYLKAHNKGIQDVILCEDRNDGCKNVAVWIHHIVFKSQGGSDEADNLVALCLVCHGKRHNLNLKGD